MSSSRLPGKVLKKVNGVPVLMYLVQKVKQSKKINDIIVLTSDHKTDKPIIQLCKEKEIKYLEGPLENVAKRFLLAIEKYKLSNFIRLCGDSPLLDHNILDKGVEIYEKNNFDIVTNIFPRSYPKGQSIEIINATAFKKAYNEFNNKSDFEHVTAYFYANPNRFKLFNFKSNIILNNYRMAVDTEGDFNNFKEIIESLETDHTVYDIEKLLEVIKKNNIKCII